MKLAVSNIAWDEPEQPDILQCLGRRGVLGIEVAPTKLWPGWVDASEAAAQKASDRLAAAGFAVPALQALLFGRPDLQVFGDAESRRGLIEHLGLVARLARSLGARVLVFGSPRNRDRGDLAADEAMDRAVELFRHVGEACANAGVCLCIEPNPTDYGCNFLTRWSEAAEMVERVAHPGVGLHLDAACIQIVGDDAAEAVRQCGGIMRHFHASEPQLGAFASPTIDHARIGQALRDSGYAGWISIEMRRTDDPLASVARAVDHVTACYG